MTNPTALRRWLAARARPLPLDPTEPFELPESLSAATVVGLASSVRSAAELVAATHVLLRALVERHGFRAVTIEGTDATGAALDEFIHTGQGDPAALIAASQRFLRTHQTLELVRWLRAWNTWHPEDAVSIVHAAEPTEPDGLAEIEANLAHANLSWHAATGQRIVHWGGIAHLVAGAPRTVPPDQTHRNAGGIMRAELGAGYGVAALTVGAGSAPFDIPAPPADFAEAAFADIPFEAALLEVRAVADGTAPPVAEWLRRPLRTRMIGPVYDASRDHDFRIDAGPLIDSVDVFVHAPRITPVSSLRS